MKCIPLCLALVLVAMFDVACTSEGMSSGTPDTHAEYSVRVIRDYQYSADVSGDNEKLAGDCTNCDDGSVCTTDSCALSGECTHTTIEECLPCTSGADCQLMVVGCYDDHTFHFDGLSGLCLPQGFCETYHEVKSCDDNYVCTDDDCLGEDDTCEHSPVDCDDGNPCTMDTCFQEAGCGHQAIPNCFH